MSLFDKILIPLIEPLLKPIDFSAVTGFISCFTEDPDKPNSDKEFFIAFDNNKRNKYVEDLSKRLSTSVNVKRQYIKLVNNKPYCIYSFFVKPELKKYFNGVLSIKTEHKNKIANFWSTLDNDVNTIFQNSIITVNGVEKMPLADYNRSNFDKKGLIVK